MFAPRLRHGLRSQAGGFVLGVATTVGVLLGVARVGSVAAHAPPRLDREAFHVALDEVMDRYVEPIDEGELLQLGLKHIVGELDPNSHYLTAKERKALAQRADQASAGLSVLVHGRATERLLEVASVEPASSAEAAGLAAGDRILAIDGRDASVLGQIEAETLLGGRVGDHVRLRVATALTTPRDLQLEFRESHAPVVEGQLLHESGGDVAVIRIRAFRSGVAERVKERLATFRQSSELDGIVLDLRSNPGGEIAEAVGVADLFMAAGPIARTRGRGGRILREEVAHPLGSDTKTPLVVLQDRHSASAAELLAAALQDAGRARIVGERSFGKGTVQQLIGLSDGSVLALTVARYFSPRDRAIDGTGVTPDVELVLGSDDAAERAAVTALGLNQEG